MTYGPIIVHGDLILIIDSRLENDIVDTTSNIVSEVLPKTIKENILKKLENLTNCFCSSIKNYPTVDFRLAKNHSAV